MGPAAWGRNYRARDTKLNREVALKILPDAFTRDPDRLARFKREAQVLASLNHPHIGAIYGFEDSGETHALVLELVEGLTLAEKLAERSRVTSRVSGLPLDEALSIARQMAEALEAAHEQGIIHRDLKPSNIKVTPDGVVKVLDFGLARAMEVEPAASAMVTHSPTLSLLATQAGMILGTAAYMSPEQAKGAPADHRSDVFSFGCVLYEMLIGRQPFHGETAPEVMASVLVREADLTALPPNLNPRISDLLRRCLDKNPKRRWQAIGDLRAELEVVGATPRTAPAAKAVVVPVRPLWRRAIPVVLTAIVAGVLASAATRYLRPSQAPLVVTRFPFTLGEGQAFLTGTIARQFNSPLVAISPDGAQMAYLANGRLYLRSMSELEARLIVGADAGSFLMNPAFSPDSRSVAFWSSVDQTFKKVAVSGGAAITICPAEAPFGMSWSAAGIVFGQGDKGVMRVSANGGTPEVLVRVKDGEQAYGPQILPGGSGERKTLVDGGSDARYVPTGHLVYAVGGILFAVPMDFRRLEVTGGPVPIVEGVRRTTTNITGVAHFGFSSTGSLIYLPGPVSTGVALMDLALIDRKGSVEPLKLPPGPYQHPRVSPSGTQIAVATDDGKEAIVWIYELGSTTSMRRLTFGGKNRFPIWSADGQRVAFQSDREGDLGIFWQRADGSGAAERLTKPDQGTSHVPESWSPKGERFLFGVTKGLSVSPWTFSLQDQKATQFADVQSPLPINAAFSLDGRWVAYTALEERALGIYVQPFPATGAKYQVSKTSGVIHPVWSRDGRELVSQPFGQWVVQTITTQPSFAFSAPVPVPRGGAIGTPPAAQRNYDVTPDGRILGVVAAGQTQAAGSAPPQIQVVLNWLEELKQRVPVK